MTPSTPISDSVSLSSSPSSTSSWNDNNTVLSRLAYTMRDTRMKVETKTLELNATMQEKLPEWKLRGAMYSNMARETGIEWSRRGKEAVDRWKKEFAESTTPPLPPRRSTEGVFGMPLEQAVAMTRLDTMVPAIVQRCIDYLDQNGVREVGIYRITGSLSMIQKFRSLFDDGSDVDLSILQPDPHVISALLKTYLRELPHPIISVDIGNDGDFSPSTVRKIVSQLPVHNVCLLRRLCRHLKNVVDHQDENRMSTSNLAVVFIPTLNISRALFHCMIDHYSEVFAPPPPPPVPRKPQHIKTHQPKTLSDPNVIATVRIPPAKPNRGVKPSPSSSSSTQQQPSNDRAIDARKPRSKSMSSSSVTTTTTHTPVVPWRRAGSKVEAIGRQFENK
ncbi:hypothetical protein LRAMOSA09381 [Lichtheimia ramosa]|uniref:Rho-GAP domain-containing protein n=1 Tax=Lichtheimia ramosa TaxID=688394 RepID=A0A077WGS6_9FUNG|nr:hypothetical protein LRAMOSA09381 [Lichtheimia ramosa]